MGRTIAEKVLSDRSGSDARAGDIVKAEVDYVMVNDVTGPIAFREFASRTTTRWAAAGSAISSWWRRGSPLPAG